MIRIIVDVNYKPVSFINGKNISGLLDMSYSYLRSVSPIHLDYLQNMGVGATLTISIMVEQKLWGLISCHNKTPFFPDTQDIIIAEIFGNMLGGLIQGKEDAEIERKSNELLVRSDTIINIYITQNVHLDIRELIQKEGYLLQSIVPSDGFFICIDDVLISHNFPLSKNEIDNLLEQLQPFILGESFFTHHLASILPNLSVGILSICAGLMVLKLNTTPKSYWVWRRAEKSRIVSWGGNPYQKTIINQKGLISPRKSFEKYSEVVTQKSVLWDRIEKEFSKHFISQIYRLFEFLESNRQLLTQQKLISYMELEQVKHYEKLIEMLVGVIEQRDAYTAGHTRRVSEYCEAIAIEMGLDSHDIGMLKEAAMLHDIGKVTIPDSILLKPGRLTSKEYELIKLHLNVGYEILNKIDYYRPLAEIVRYHHEKYDGSGYPYKKKQNEIPILSHIMIVADAFDAMTTNRIYQTRRSVGAAIEELVKYRSQWYHPDVVDAAVRIAERQLKKSENNISQIPFTQMEKERFSYYFKDQLTGVYNTTYLLMVIQEVIPTVHFNCFVIIELKGMSEYNAKFGWYQGNIVIKKFAEVLIQQIAEEQLFRIFGDDFLICFRTQEAKETFLSFWQSIVIGTIQSTCRSIEKETFLEAL